MSQYRGKNSGFFKQPDVDFAGGASFVGGAPPRWRDPGRRTEMGKKDRGSSSGATQHGGSRSASSSSPWPIQPTESVMSSLVAETDGGTTSRSCASGQSSTSQTTQAHPGSCPQLQQAPAMPPQMQGLQPGHSIPDMCMSAIRPQQKWQQAGMSIPFPAQEQQKQVQHIGNMIIPILQHVQHGAGANVLPAQPPQVQQHGGTMGMIPFPQQPAAGPLGQVATPGTTMLGQHQTAAQHMMLQALQQQMLMMRLMMQDDRTGSQTQSADNQRPSPTGSGASGDPAAGARAQPQAQAQRQPPEPPAVVDRGSRGPRRGAVEGAAEEVLAHAGGGIGGRETDYTLGVRQEKQQSLHLHGDTVATAATVVKPGSSSSSTTSGRIQLGRDEPGGTLQKAFEATWNNAPPEMVDLTCGPVPVTTIDLTTTCPINLARADAATRSSTLNRQRPRLETVPDKPLVPDLHVRGLELAGRGADGGSTTPRRLLLSAAAPKRRPGPTSEHNPYGGAARVVFSTSSTSAATNSSTSCAEQSPATIRRVPQEPPAGGDTMMVPPPPDEGLGGGEGDEPEPEKEIDYNALFSKVEEDPLELHSLKTRSGAVAQQQPALPQGGILTGLAVDENRNLIESGSRVPANVWMTNKKLAAPKKPATVYESDGLGVKPQSYDNHPESKRRRLNKRTTRGADSEADAAPEDTHLAVCVELPASSLKTEAGSSTHTAASRTRRGERADGKTGSRLGKALRTNDEEDCSSADDRNRLPTGWEARSSSTTGKTYYINKKTRETTWTKPTRTAGKTVARERDCVSSDHRSVQNKKSAACGKFKNSWDRWKQSAAEIQGTV